MKAKSKHTAAKSRGNSNSNKDNKIFGINLNYIVFGIAILCLVLSILIMNEKKYYETGEESICMIITDGDGCQIVQTSKYASLFGFKNPYLGIFGFALLALAALANNFTKNTNIKKLSKYMIILAGFAAGALALYFIYIQAFILTIYCIFCVCVDILSLILLAISIYLLAKR
ncbi:MAG TPA: vitamin K epoxide reductase family protein [Alphaproteobacteria bacterium]|nr:vitamin K epoxide reductase family protein [Alphaproteobacteria bacterium]